MASRATNIASPSSSGTTHSRGTLRAQRLAGIGRDAAHHHQRDEDDVGRLHHREAGRADEAEQVQVDRQQHRQRAGGRRDADEEVLLPVRPVGIVDHDVEARQAQRARHGVDQHHDPAERGEVVQAVHVQHEARRDAEADEVGERIELGPEARGGLEQARDAPVEAVQHCGDEDGDDGAVELVVALHGQPHGREARAQRHQRHKVGQDARGTAPR